MVCPNCGNKIPDGDVYCEKCGGEVFVVSDIEDIDNLEMSLEVKKNLVEPDVSDFIDDGMTYDDEPNALSLILSGKAGGKSLYIMLGIIFIFVIIGAIFVAHKISANNGLEHQLEMAQNAINNENYQSAIDYFEKAYKISGNNEYLFTAADYYYTLGRDNDAIFTLKEIVGSKSSSEEDKISAYKKIITLYEEAKSYTNLNELITNCEIEEIKKNYSKYMVSAPRFNHEAGTYQEAIDLSLATPLSGGRIYYTIGNSTPNESSDVYSSPIPLTYGSYTINAIYVNEFGVASEVVTNKYLIDVAFVFTPRISLESGDYTSAQTITASVPAMYTLYYTTDGTDPDKNSTRYTGPIPLPLGESTYKFIEYAADGTVSNIVERNYTLTYNTAITAENAIPYFMNVLVQRGINSDIEGHRNGLSGTYLYIFTTAYNIPGKGDYFFIVEYYVDEFGNNRKTGDIYAMHVISADKLFKVTTENGAYKLINF